MPDWTPKTEGAFELPWMMEPLKNVQGEFSVFSGLAQLNARALGDGGGDHARSGAAFLTGSHPAKTAGADIKNGISVDQYAAQKLGALTKFPSLEIGIEQGNHVGQLRFGLFLRLSIYDFVARRYHASCQRNQPSRGF